MPKYGFARIAHKELTLKLATIALAAALSLAACSKTDTPGGQPGSGNSGSSSSPAAAAARPAAALQPAQALETVVAQGKGFTVGAMMAANTVYVLFDPQCPHCGHLWEASLPLHGKVKFVWMPVSIMNAKSGPQGAALLTAANPAELMASHEKSLLAGAGGIAASASIPAEISDAIKRNTALMTTLGADSVPYLIAMNSRTGNVVSHGGAMTSAALASLLGFD